jgi:hypothetical protein
MAPRLLFAFALLATAACSSRSSAPAPAPGPTYHADVAPILASRCAGCHEDGGIAPFSLTDYGLAKTHAMEIAAATAARIMPPSNVDASGACQSYANARWLSDDEIATLENWAAAGAPEGAPSNDPAPAALAHLDDATARVDLGATYVPNAELSDDYRCFVIDVGQAEDAFLTAYEVAPGEPREVHHVILYGLTDHDAEAKAVELDDGEPGPGYTCFGGPGTGGAFGVLAAWAPGTSVTRYPEGTGIRVRARSKAVLQIHYNLAAGALPDATSIALKLEPRVEKEAMVLPAVDLDLTLPPRSAAAVATRDQELTDDATYHLLGVFPHMHQLGTSLKVERIRDGESSCVVDVPRWNFHWQEFFFYERPIDVVRGDIARITCTYDTRTRSSTTKWGEGTDDEMCIAGFYVTKDAWRVERGPSAP